MPQCPKCSYELVLLSSRSKYKCSLCSRLYPQKSIEDKEFREWNKRKRKEDFEHNLLEEVKDFVNLKEINKQLKSLFSGPTLNSLSKEEREKIRKEYYKINKERINKKNKEYYYKNREKLLEQDDMWRENNKEKISLTRKKWLENNIEKRKEYLKAYKIRNQSLERQGARLKYWRGKQNKLTDQYLENYSYEPYNLEFHPFSPTFALCDLLVRKKILKALN